jgi:hypothetical protein
VLDLARLLDLQCAYDNVLYHRVLMRDRIAVSGPRLWLAGLCHPVCQSSENENSTQELEQRLDELEGDYPVEGSYSGNLIPPQPQAVPK